MIEIIMPKSGLTMEEGTIVEWHFEVGDQVNKGDIIADIETDKSILELESPASGTLKEILFGADETVEIGTIIGYIQ